jgi:hypothetical protein
VRARGAFTKRWPIVPLVHRGVRLHLRRDLRGAAFEPSARLGIAELFRWDEPGGAVVRLRTRFMLWFGLAALVPIAVAAVVTRAVVARSYRDEYQRTRGAAERAAKAELERLEAQLEATATALASRDHPVIGNLLQDLVKDGGALTSEARRRLREQVGPEMAGLGLDGLTIVGPDDLILAAPHKRGTVGDPDPEAAPAGGRAAHPLPPGQDHGRAGDAAGADRRDRAPGPGRRPSRWSWWSGAPSTRA